MIKTNIMKVAVIVLFCVVLLTACKQNPAKPTEPSDTEPVSTEQVTEPVTGESRMWFLSKYEIDLTGDGLNERIEIEGYAPTKESAKTAIWQDGFGKVTIYQGGSLQEDKVLFSTEISKKHEGLGDLAVCDYYGRNCLVRFENTPRSGRNEFWYEVIGFLEDGTTEVLKKDYAFYSAPLSIEDPIQIQAEGQMRLNPVEVTENLVRVHDGLDEILQGKNTVVLSFSSVSSFSFYYEPENVHTFTAYEVFTSALEDGFPRGKGVMYALLNGWEEKMQDLLNNKYEEQIRNEWKKIEPGVLKTFHEYNKLEDVHCGKLEMEQETTILPEPTKDSRYQRITDSRFQSTSEIETLIQSTCSGNLRKYWSRRLVYSDRYMDYEGALYYEGGGIYGDSPFPLGKVLSFGKITEDCWLVTMDAGVTYYDNRLRAIELGIVKENGKWKIAFNSESANPETPLYRDKVGLNPYSLWRGNPETIELQPGTLSKEQVNWFNEKYFNQTEVEPDQIRNYFLNSVYQSPKEIDLYKLFYNGTGYNIKSGDSLTDYELSLLEDMGAPTYLDKWRIDPSSMDLVLMEHAGIRRKDTNQINLDKFYQSEEIGNYYNCSGNSYYRKALIQSGYCTEDGTIVLIYTLEEDIEEATYQVTLKEVNDGYHFVSNVIVTEDDKSLDDLIHERNYPAAIAHLRGQTTPEVKELFDKICYVMNGDFIVASNYYIAAVNEDNTVSVAYAEGREIKDVLNTQWNNVRQLIESSAYPCAVSKEGKILVPEGERPEDYEAWIDRNMEAGLNIGVTIGNMPESARSILSWENIKNAQGDYPYHLLGVFADGTVNQVGLDSMGWDDTNVEDATSWTDIIDVKLYAFKKAIALDRNGRVHTLNEENLDWKNVVAIETSQNAAFALTEDGHVLSSNRGIKTDAMTDVIAIAGGLNGVVGLRADGTVIDRRGNSIEGLEDVVAIDYSAEGFIIGLKADGTLCISGKIDTELQEEALSWTELYVPEV